MVALAKVLLTTRCLRNSSDITSESNMLGIQQPKDALVVYKRALAETRQARSKNNQVP
jgi:hypothetical protein